VELSAGNLLMYSRVQQGVTGSGVQWFSNSTDNGETWGTPYASTMISPMAPAKVIKLQDGRLLAAHCYSTTVRAPLVLSTSNDNGATWSKVFTISDFPDRDITYPSILERDGYLYITHWEQLRVKPVYSLVFTKIALADL
jgi:sialidase-1